MPGGNVSGIGPRPGSRPDPAERSSLLAALHEQHCGPLVVVDPASSRFVLVNQRAAELVGATVEELTGATWQEFVDAEEVGPGQERTEQLMSGALDHVSFRSNLRLGDGTHTTFGLTVTRLRVGDRTLLAVQADDLIRDGNLSALIRLVAEHPPGDILARAMVLGVLDGFSVRAASLYRVDPDHGVFTAVGTHGVPLQLLSGFEQVPIDAQLPIGHVYRSGTEYHASIAAMKRAYPLSNGWVDHHPDPDNTEISVLPVHTQGVVAGVIILASDQALGRTWQARHLLDTLCACFACWLAMDRDGRSAADNLGVRGELVVTDRQRRVLQLVAAGRTNQQIASELGFSEGTIRSDLVRLTRLMRARGRANLVEAARRAGLL